MPELRGRRNLVEQIQRAAPEGRAPARRALTLLPAEIHPVVRIAHRQSGGLTIPRRIIFDHELVLILSGTGEFTLDGSAHRYGPHDLIFIPPFVRHFFRAGADGPGEHIAVHFDFSPGCPGRSGGLDRRRPYRVRFPHGLRIATHRRLLAGHRLERELKGVVEALHCGSVLGPALAASRLAGVLLGLLSEPNRQRPGGGGGRNQLRVQAVAAHMASNLASRLDHGALERLSGLSPSRLQALFREVTGYPPLEYLRRLRVEEARRLLADRRLSVKEVGARTGFRDTSHFSKVFRRVDGLSPAHYRDALFGLAQEK